MGQGIAMPGYEVTLADFRQLLSYPLYREQTAPLLLEWYGYSVTGDEAETTVVTPTGQPVEIPALHAVIQADPEKQGRLYRTAMTLWR
jgi:hypothetical protein